MANDQKEPDYGKVIFARFGEPGGRHESDASLAIPSLKDGDGGGTSGGMSDDWKTSVNGQLTQLHGDVRKLLGGIIALGLIGASLYAVLVSKIEDLAIGQATLIEKVSASDKKIDGIETKLERIDGKLDQLVAEKPSKR